MLTVSIGVQTPATRPEIAKVLPDPLRPKAQNCRFVPPVAKTGLCSHWPVRLNLNDGGAAP